MINFDTLTQGNPAFKAGQQAVDTGNRLALRMQLGNALMQLAAQLPQLVGSRRFVDAVANALRTLVIAIIQQQAKLQLDLVNWYARWGYERREHLQHSETERSVWNQCHDEIVSF